MPKRVERLPKCPICGAKVVYERCMDEDGKVAKMMCCQNECCPYVAGVHAHRAICAKLAQRGRVVAKGWWCSIAKMCGLSHAACAYQRCSKDRQEVNGCRRVAIVEDKGKAVRG